MPIYEYRCEACGHDYSHLHKRLGEKAPNCPKCTSENVRKTISSFSPGISAAASAAPCAGAESCPTAAAGGHSCCAGCHHHA